LSERLVRGFVIMSAVSYIEQRMEPGARTRSLAALPPDLREAIRGMQRNGWYPAVQCQEAYRAVSMAWESPPERYEELTKCGRSIAQDATNTFLRLLIRFLTPAVFARKFGDFWRKDHNFGNVENDPTHKGSNSLVLNMSGVEGYEFIAPVARGWMSMAFEAIGKKGVSVKETQHSFSRFESPTYRFLVEWQ
jgi:hypothetical protein